MLTTYDIPRIAFLEGTWTKVPRKQRLGSPCGRTWDLETIFWFVRGWKQDFPTVNVDGVRIFLVHIYIYVEFCWYNFFKLWRTLSSLSKMRFECVILLHHRFRQMHLISELNMMKPEQSITWRVEFEKFEKNASFLGRLMSNVLGFL